MAFMRETRDCGCIVDINPYGGKRYIRRCKNHTDPSDPFDPLSNIRWKFKKK